MTNEQAQSAFIQAVENCRQLLEQLQAHVGDHLCVDPDDVNWGDVGDVRSLESLLHRACNDSGMPVWTVGGSQFRQEE